MLLGLLYWIGGSSSAGFSCLLDDRIAARRRHRGKRTDLPISRDRKAEIHEDDSKARSAYSHKFCLTIACTRALLISSQFHVFSASVRTSPGFPGQNRAWSIDSQQLDFNPEGAIVPEETPSNQPSSPTSPSVGPLRLRCRGLAYITFIPAIIFLATALTTRAPTCASTPGNRSS
jgi:hypothetical protein